jgi:hypothetical protein
VVGREKIKGSVPVSVVKIKGCVLVSNTKGSVPVSKGKRPRFQYNSAVYNWE